MTRSFIRDYKEAERLKGIEIAEPLLSENHTILNAQAIYPEYELRAPYAVHRPGVNIGALIFLYRQVIAYIPPMTRRQFRARFGINYQTFLQLAFPHEPKMRFIYPVLNHPHRYASPLILQELSEILVHKPPTWERWHSSLYVSGGNRWFVESDARFNYRNLWNIPDLRQTWKAKLKTTSQSFISREIKQQVKNNYTDLCLVNKKQKANYIAELSHVDPELSINELLFSSDLYAYPAVLGAGGFANVRAVHAPPIVKDRPLEEIPKLLPETKYFDTEVITGLLEGLRFDSIPREFRLDFLLEWHKSANAEKARNAYLALLNCAKEQFVTWEVIHSTMKTILKELQEFCRNAEPSFETTSKTAARRQNLISGITASGGIACTLVGLFHLNIIMALAGIGFTLVGVKNWTNYRRVMEGILKEHAPHVSPDLYWRYYEIRGFTEDFWRRLTPKLKRKIEVEQFEEATSVPVRTLWWEE